MLTVPKLPALLAIYTLAISDPLAAIVGVRFGGHRIRRNRSVEGSCAFFAATAAIAAAVFYWAAVPLSE